VLIIAMMISAVFGGSLWVVIWSVGIGFGVNIARVTRPELRRVLHSDFVLAGKASGLTPSQNLWRHLMPNVAPVFIVQLSWGMAVAVLAEAGLSYLGLGAPPTEPSWGLLLAQLQQYIDKRWQFVAVKLAADADAGAALDGTLAPIQLTFPTDSPVYPLGMARAATTPQSLRLNVFSDNRVDLVRDGTADQSLDAAVRTVWAGPVTEPALTGLGGYLTVVDLTIDTPATQITSDIGIVRAPDDDVVDPSAVVVRPIELLGFPLGTLLAVWAGLGLLGLVVVTIARSRLR
jgi:hypothetical protein